MKSGFGYHPGSPKHQQGHHQLHESLKHLSPSPTPSPSVIATLSSSAEVGGEDQPQQQIAPNVYRSQRAVSVSERIRKFSPSSNASNSKTMDEAQQPSELSATAMTGSSAKPGSLPATSTSSTSVAAVSAGVTAMPTGTSTVTVPPPPPPPAAAAASTNRAEIETPSPSTVQALKNKLWDENENLGNFRNTTTATRRTYLPPGSPTALSVARSLPSQRASSGASSGAAAAATTAAAAASSPLETIDVASPVPPNRVARSSSPASTQSSSFHRSLSPSVTVTRSDGEDTTRSALSGKFSVASLPESTRSLSTPFTANKESYQHSSIKRSVSSNIETPSSSTVSAIKKQLWDNNETLQVAVRPSWQYRHAKQQQQQRIEPVRASGLSDEDDEVVEWSDERFERHSDVGVSYDRSASQQQQFDRHSDVGVSRDRPVGALSHRQWRQSDRRSDVGVSYDRPSVVIPARQQRGEQSLDSDSPDQSAKNPRLSARSGLLPRRTSTSSAGNAEDEEKKDEEQKDEPRSLKRDDTVSPRSLSSPSNKSAMTWQEQRQQILERNNRDPSTWDQEAQINQTAENTSVGETQEEEQQEQDWGTEQEDEDVAQLVAKLTAVNRQDPAEALAKIDSILDASSKSTISAHDYEQTQALRSLAEDYRRQQQHENLADEYLSDAETSVSSITNPTYQSTFGKRSGAKPNILQGYQKNKNTEVPLQSIKVKSPRADSTLDASDPAVIAMKIRAWDELSGNPSNEMNSTEERVETLGASPLQLPEDALRSATHTRVKQKFSHKIMEEKRSRDDATNPQIDADYDDLMHLPSKSDDRLSGISDQISPKSFDSSVQTGDGEVHSEHNDFEKEAELAQTDSSVTELTQSHKNIEHTSTHSRALTTHVSRGIFPSSSVFTADSQASRKSTKSVDMLAEAQPVYDNSDATSNQTFPQVTPVQSPRHTTSESSTTPRRAHPWDHHHPKNKRLMPSPFADSKFAIRAEIPIETFNSRFLHSAEAIQEQEEAHQERSLAEIAEKTALKTALSEEDMMSLPHVQGSMNSKASESSHIHSVNSKPVFSTGSSFSEDEVLRLRESYSLKEATAVDQCQLLRSSPVAESPSSNQSGFSGGPFDVNPNLLNHGSADVPDQTNTGGSTQPGEFGHAFDTEWVELPGKEFFPETSVPKISASTLATPPSGEQIPHSQLSRDSSEKLRSDGASPSSAAEQRSRLETGRPSPIDVTNGSSTSKLPKVEMPPILDEHPASPARPEPVTKSNTRRKVNFKTILRRGKKANYENPKRSITPRRMRRSKSPAAQNENTPRNTKLSKKFSRFMRVYDD